MLHNNKLLYTISASSGLLGFMRGMHSYDYRYNKYKNKYNQDDAYLYSSKICHGLFGACYYATPVFIALILPKEIYRLEVIIRGLTDEKKTDYYNEIL